VSIFLDDDSDVAELVTTMERLAPVREVDPFHTIHDTYAHVLVDEAQDISPVQRAMLHAMIAMKTGRLIAVGDENQSLYAFRGADSDSLRAITNEFKAIPFPLTVTYRCPTSVVELARAYVPHLTPAFNAPAGDIRMNVNLESLFADGWRPTDLVVCRNNAPLVTLAYRLLKKKIACKVLGRDIGAGGWKYELRVTDQAASGGGAASETIRTYLCSAPFGVRSLLLRDEADDDDFLLAPGLAEILIPLLAEPGR
jgi:hypothetical protein